MPAAALSATTVRHTDENQVIAITAGRGEANRITVTSADRSWVIRETGAELSADSQCPRIDAHSVRCPFTELQGEGVHPVVIRLGGRNDRLTIHAADKIDVYGGPGNDRITGGDSYERIDPGPGRDRIKGGGGQDALLYGSRRRRLTVDLARGTTNAGDRFSGIERIEAGAGDDLLLGSRGDDVFVGGGGDDVIRGRGGKDSIWGGAGADRIYGGAGDDWLIGLEGRDVIFGGTGDDAVWTRDDPPAPDRVDCGPGEDRGATGDRRDVVHSC